MENHKILDPFLMRQSDFLILEDYALLKSTKTHDKKSTVSSNKLIYKTWLICDSNYIFSIRIIIRIIYIISPRVFV